MFRLRNLLLLSTLLAAPATGTVLMPTAARAALPAANTMQAQLQAEWDDFITRMHGAVVPDGALALTQTSGGYIATLPKLTVNLQNSNKIRLDGMTVQATPTADSAVALKINLPAVTPQYYQNQKIGTLGIGRQNTTVTVKPAGDTWQVRSVSADLGGIRWQQEKSPGANRMTPVDTTVGQVKLSGQPNRLELSAGDIKTRNAGNESQSIGQLTLTQLPSGDARSMRLSDVLVLLAGAVPQLETGHGAMTNWLQGAAGMKAHVQNLRATKADGSLITAVEDMVLQNALIGAATEKLTLRMTGNVKGIQLGMPAAFASAAPQTIDFTATARNVPAAYLSMPFNTPQAKTAARAALAEAGTQLQIDSLDILTKGGLKADGTGLLTASNTGPTYTTGTVTLNIANLQSTMAQMQSDLKSGGGKTANSGQIMLAMMLLQGMGKADGTRTQYVVNFTPSGQVLLNDQDLSGLLKMGGVGGSSNASPARALPVAPVTEEAPPAPAMSGWKR